MKPSLKADGKGRRIQSLTLMMQPRFYSKVLLAFFLLTVLSGCQDIFSSKNISSGSSKPVWQACFSPRGGCTELVVNTLKQAKSTVLVQAYSFTSAPIAQALVDAFRRGVKVEVILDKSQKTADYSEADFLGHSKVPVYIDSAHSIAHNKVMIIDGETLITGSFNFTKAAEERNAENLLVLKDKEMAAAYEKNFIRHKGHSQAYAAR